MRAMVLLQPNRPLLMQNLPMPAPGPDELQVEVLACGLCRTDLHVVDGELPEPRLPLVPGHQIVGRITAMGENASGWSIGQCVGIPWLGGSCGHCGFCRDGRENLCDEARYTGYQRDGGFAEFAVADARYCFPIPSHYNAVQAAPLLCAGLIGYRAYRLAIAPELGPVARLGFYGFGAAAHILIQVARHQGRRVAAFTRRGDEAARRFALELGADWAGPADERPAQSLDAAIIFAPAGELVPAALAAVRKGGRVVCAGIHMSDIPAFPYALLWGERSLCSVANLTRRDGEEFLPLAASIPVATHVRVYDLEAVNEALADLRDGRLTGAAVVVP